PTSSPRTLSARNPDDPERLGRGVLEMSPLALPAVAPVGREAPGGQLPHAQPQYCRRGKARSELHAGARLRLALGFRGFIGDQYLRLARDRPGGDEGGARPARARQRSSDPARRARGGNRSLRLGQSWNSHESLFECAPQASRCRTGTARPPHERERRAGAPAVSPGEARTGALAREIKPPPQRGSVSLAKSYLIGLVKGKTFVSPRMSVMSSTTKISSSAPMMPSPPAGRLSSRPASCAASSSVSAATRALTSAARTP